MARGIDRPPRIIGSTRHAGFSSETKRKRRQQQKVDHHPKKNQTNKTKQKNTTSPSIVASIQLALARDLVEVRCSGSWRRRPRKLTTKKRHKKPNEKIRRFRRSMEDGEDRRVNSNSFKFNALLITH